MLMDLTIGWQTPYYACLTVVVSTVLYRTGSTAALPSSIISGTPQHAPVSSGRNEGPVALPLDGEERRAAESPRESRRVATVSSGDILRVRQMLTGHQQSALAPSAADQTAPHTPTHVQMNSSAVNGTVLAPPSSPHPTTSPPSDVVSTSSLSSGFISTTLSPRSDVISTTSSPRSDVTSTTSLTPLLVDGRLRRRTVLIRLSATEISAVVLGIAAALIIAVLVSAALVFRPGLSRFLKRRSILSEPVLEDTRLSYINASTDFSTSELADDLDNLDNDSFLNSLESMPAPAGCWARTTETNGRVPHTKL